MAGDGEENADVFRFDVACVDVVFRFSCYVSSRDDTDLVSTVGFHGEDGK